MTGPSTWIAMAIFALVALLGIVLAATAVDTAMYVFGLGLFAFGALFDFWLIKRSVG